MPFTSILRWTLARAMRRFRRDEGAAMVEFAIVLPVFLAITWGVIDFGRLFFTSNALANAAREGARYAAVLSPLDTPAVKARVKASFVPFGGPALTDAEIDINTTTITGAVIVSINSYPAPVLTPLARLIGSTSTMTRKVTFRIEHS